MKINSSKEVHRQLAKNIRQCRIQANLSQEELAKAMGKTKAWVQRQELEGRLDLHEFLNWCSQCRLSMVMKALAAEQPKVKKPKVKK